MSTKTFAASAICGVAAAALLAMTTSTEAAVAGLNGDVLVGDANQFGGPGGGGIETPWSGPQHSRAAGSPIPRSRSRSRPVA